MQSHSSKRYPTLWKGMLRGWKSREKGSQIDELLSAEILADEATALTTARRYQRKERFSVFVEKRLKLQNMRRQLLVPVLKYLLTNYVYSRYFTSNKKNFKFWKTGIEWRTIYWTAKEQKHPMCQRTTCDTCLSIKFLCQVFHIALLRIEFHSKYPLLNAIYSWLSRHTELNS